MIVCGWTFRLVCHCTIETGLRMKPITSYQNDEIRTIQVKKKKSKTSFRYRVTNTLTDIVEKFSFKNKSNMFPPNSLLHHIKKNDHFILRIDFRLSESSFLKMKIWKCKKKNIELDSREYNIKGYIHILRFCQKTVCSLFGFVIRNKIEGIQIYGNDIMEPQDKLNYNLISICIYMPLMWFGLYLRNLVHNCLKTSGEP